MMTLPVFSKMYARYKGAGLSVRDFCHNEGFQEARFYYWQKKLRSNPAPPLNQRGFVPLLLNDCGRELRSPVPAGKESLSLLASGCRICYANGTNLELVECPDMQTLSRLLSLNP
jgi:hypothetical protein